VDRGRPHEGAEAQLSCRGHRLPQLFALRTRFAGGVAGVPRRLLFGLQLELTICFFGIGALGRYRRIALRLLRALGIAGFPFGLFVVADSLVCLALGSACRAGCQPFRERRVDNQGLYQLFLIDPNYAAGRDVAAGVKANFKGEVVGEEYTPWPGQLDFSAELTKARAAKPDAVFAFYPGSAGAQFLTQYAQAGLKGQLPLYTAFMLDALSLPKIGALALGIATAGHWAIDLPNAANQKFVADFRAAYKRDPSFYAAQAYDAANFINSAVAAVKGDLTNKDGMRAAMEKAGYASVRGPYRYGNNHFPIQNFYLQEVVERSDGTFEIKTVATILKDHQDRYHDKCPMK